MITLTQEQIENGRTAAMKRTNWRPTPPEAVEMAHRLWQERGKFRERVECREVAASIGWSYASIRQRYLMGELGLPTPHVARAQAFAAGDFTYTRADGSVHRVNDDMDYRADQEKWAYQGDVRRKGWWGRARASFDDLTQGDVGALWRDSCPCCGVAFWSGGGQTRPTLDHLVPGVRSKNNARLICNGCNTVKSDALPYHLRRVAQWMKLSPAAMIERARSLPEMGRRRVDGQDRRRVMLQGKKAAAKECDIPFSLTLDDVPFSASCPVLDVPFLLMGSVEMTAALEEAGVRNKAFWNSASFDRIDPRRGYEPGNVVLVSHLANSIMQNATSADRIEQVADWFERELEAAPELKSLIDYDAHAHWGMAAE